MKTGKQQVRQNSTGKDIRSENMKIIDTKSLGTAIRERRKELHYTQTYLAEFSGLSVSFISDLERGKATAEIGKTLQIIHLLGMDILVEKRG